MKWLRILILCCVGLGMARAGYGQDLASDLLLRINNLRGELGLPRYRWNAQLAQAAQNHASWLTQTGISSHRQSDGSLAPARARRAGYPGAVVHENYYMGTQASAGDAWHFWLNSAPHYSNLSSPRLSEIGIASARGQRLSAYVLVFGHASSSAPAPSGGAAAAAAPAQPAYVLGLDELGNIQHEIQPGHTIGDIALIYGYTWDDIPAMLELNGITWDDIRFLQPGSVFLVPPQAGTYTPTSPPSATASPATDRPQPTDTPRATAPAQPSSLATRPLRIDSSASELSSASSAGANSRLLLLTIAILVQAVALSAALMALVRLWR